MTDKEAYEEWCKPRMSNIEPDHPSDAWHAACAYKDKRVKELEEEVQVKHLIIMDQAREIELLRGLLTEALPFVNAELPHSLSIALRITDAL